jgi:hypothetical protein
MVLNCLIIFSICKIYSINNIEEVPILLYFLLFKAKSRFIAFVLGYSVMLFTGLPIPGQSIFMISILKFFEKIPNSFYEDISKL